MKALRTLYNKRPGPVNLGHELIASGLPPPPAPSNFLYAELFRQQICPANRLGQAAPRAHVWLWSSVGQQLLTNFNCIPGCKKCFGHRKGKSARARNCSVCPRKEEREQVDATNWRRDAEAAVTCVGGDGCCMPAAWALAIFCRFVGSTAGGRLGEMPEHGRDAQQPRHNPGLTHCRPGAASKDWEPLARETFEIFSFHKRVFAGQIWHWVAKLASAAWVWDPHLRHPRLLCKRDVTLGWAAPARSCYVTGVSTHLYNVCSLSQQQHYYLFSFQTLKVGKEGKLMAPKNTSRSPLSREGFHIPLAP